MITNKLRLRIIANFFSILIVFQSCATYQGNYTMMDAFKSKKGVKLLTNGNEQIEYQKIDTLNGQWVGLKIINDDKLEYEPINTQSIVKIQIKRSKKSEQNEGLIIVGIMAGVVLVILGLISAANNISIYGDN